MSITGLRHISLKTCDLKKTERFYTKVLGLKIAFRVPPKMIFFRSPGKNDLLGFIKSTKKFDPKQSLDHFGFKVSKAALKQTEKKLKKSRIEIEDRRDRTAIYFRDPNGYWIEFYCD